MMNALLVAALCSIILARTPAARALPIYLNRKDRRRRP